MSAPSLLRGRRGLGLRAPGLLGPELFCAGLADWLFWGQGVGLSLPVFCAVVAGVAHLLRPARWGAGRAGLVGVVVLAGLAPAVECLTPLSLALALLGTVVSVHLGPARDPEGWPCRLRVAALASLGGPRQMIRDARVRRRRSSRGSVARAGRPASWLAWVVPCAMLALFLGLFAIANPLIAAWLADVPAPSWSAIATAIVHAPFWLCVAAAVWPVIRVRRARACRPAGPRTPGSDGLADAAAGKRAGSILLSPAAILRALVLLDLLFALQLALDGAYLWGGMALPEGLTYAAYAHRGAYPLVATALLAGGFALLVRREGAAAAPAAPAGRLVPALLLLFIGQNVLLMVSAMRRLALYVEAYALTEWRLAAFAWMGLVAAGLALMAVQVARGRNNRWLLGRVALAGAAVLYGWCFLDAPRLVADYDVAHCAELQGTGPELDTVMMVRLGPAAIPAVDLYLRHLMPDGRRPGLVRWRAEAAAALRREAGDWRRWSLRGWRLGRYLDTSGVEEPPVPAGPSDEGE